MIIGKQFAQKLYSTGNEELDDLLERAFCEGYELAQREYAEKKEKEEESNPVDEEAEKKARRKEIGKKVLKGTGIAAGSALALAGAYQGQKAIRKSILKNKIKKEANQEVAEKLRERFNKISSNNKLDSFGHNKIENPIKNLFNRKKTSKK